MLTKTGFVILVLDCYGDSLMKALTLNPPVSLCSFASQLSWALGFFWRAFSRWNCAKACKRKKVHMSEAQEFIADVSLMWSEELPISVTCSSLAGDWIALKGDMWKHMEQWHGWLRLVRRCEKCAWALGRMCGWCMCQNGSEVEAESSSAALYRSHESRRKVCLLPVFLQRSSDLMKTTLSLTGP